jgi:hypothetical protein
MADDALTIKLDPKTAAELAAQARAEGVSPEQYAAALVADAVSAEALPPLTISDEELGASIEEQRREIAAGAAVLHDSVEVLGAARTKLQRALEAKS